MRVLTIAMATNHLESSQSSAKAQSNWILKWKARIMENQHPVLGDEWCFMMPVKTTLVAEAFFNITGVSWNMRLQFLPLALEAKKRHHRMIQVYIQTHTHTKGLGIYPTKYPEKQSRQPSRHLLGPIHPQKAVHLSCEISAEKISQTLLYMYM